MNTEFMHRLTLGQIFQDAEDQQRRERAVEYAHAYLNRVFPNLVKDLRFEHHDSGGYWFSFELVNDPRRQTWCVRPSDLD